MNHIDSYGWTGLYGACWMEKLEVVKILVDHPSINLNIKNNDGDNALYWGINNEEIARVLLESGKINIC